MPPLTDTLIAHYHEVVDFLSLRTGSRDAAQDCAQDTYLKLARAQPEAAVGNFKSYVFRVAANIATDWHRQRGRERSLLAGYERNRIATDAPDTAELVALRQTIARLEGVILAQPRRTREIFLLHKFDGLSYREIARRFELSVSAVEKHMMRVLLACRTVMQE